MKINMVLWDGKRNEIITSDDSGTALMCGTRDVAERIAKERGLTRHEVALSQRGDGPVDYWRV